MPAPRGTHFIATAVNSPGIVSSSHAGCSSKRFQSKPIADDGIYNLTDRISSVRLFCVFRNLCFMFFVIFILVISSSLFYVFRLGLWLITVCPYRSSQPTLVVFDRFSRSRTTRSCVFAANILHSENKQAISCVTVIHHHSVYNYNSSLHVDVNDLLEAGDLAIQHFGRFC